MHSPFNQAWDVIHIEQLILKIEFTDDEYAEYDAYDDSVHGPLPPNVKKRPITPPPPPKPVPAPIANQHPPPNPVSQMMAPAQGGDSPEPEGFWSSVMNPQGDSPFTQEHLANRAPAQFNTIQ